ncbi:hypothetical protein N0V94_000746 [Neodidymelliopsis sp. IMI 364377]|nr:hypothetical protein N0V94_000746 [Neodidymelliopsis sp. IMI 364377]
MASDDRDTRPPMRRVSFTAYDMPSTVLLTRHEANLDLEEECLQFVSNASDGNRKLIMDQLQVTLDSIKNFRKKYGVWRRISDSPVPMPTPTPEEPKTPTQTSVPLPSNLQARRNVPTRQQSLPLQRGKPDTATTPYKCVKWQTSVTSVNGTVSATTTGFRVILGGAKQIPVNEIANHSPVWPPTFQDFRGIATADYLTYRDDNGKVSPNNEFYVSGYRGLMPEVHQNPFPVVFQDVPTSGGGSLAKSGYAARGSSYASNTTRSNGSSGATTGAARARPLLEPVKANVLDDGLQAQNAKGEATQRTVEAKHTYAPTDAKQEKGLRRRRKQQRMQRKETHAENLD